MLFCGRLHHLNVEYIISSYLILSYLNDLTFREIQNVTYKLCLRYKVCRWKKILLAKTGVGATILTVLPTGHIRILVIGLELACN